MNKILALVLLVPMAAGAAEWRYDGEASGGNMSQSEEMASTMADSSASATTESVKGAVAMPVSVAVPPNAPTNGMTMSKVRGSVGEPESIVAAVGDPPITRWQYPEYVVYFENDLVIISVAGHL